MNNINKWILIINKQGQNVGNLQLRFKKKKKTLNNCWQIVDKGVLEKTLLIRLKAELRCVIDARAKNRSVTQCREFKKMTRRVTTKICREIVTFTVSGKTIMCLSSQELWYIETSFLSGKPYRYRTLNCVNYFTFWDISD